MAGAAEFVVVVVVEPPQAVISSARIGRAQRKKADQRCVFMMRSIALAPLPVFTDMHREVKGVRHYIMLYGPSNNFFSEKSLQRLDVLFIVVDVGWGK